MTPVQLFFRLDCQTVQRVKDSPQKAAVITKTSIKFFSVVYGRQLTKYAAADGESNVRCDTTRDVMHPVRCH